MSRQLGWSDFWKNSGAKYAIHDSPQLEKSLINFWKNEFSLVSQFDQLRVLEVCCGSGALAEYWLPLFSNKPEASWIGCDQFAPTTLSIDDDRFKLFSVDVKLLPFNSDTFNFIYSQFGIEYAGKDALLEAMRVLKSGGHLTALSHLKGSPIHDNCRQSIDILDRFLDSGFLFCFKQLMNVAWALLEGKVASKKFEEADVTFSKTVDLVKQLFREYPSAPVVRQLFAYYKDVSAIYTQIEKYERQDVLSWLDRINQEIQEFRSRQQAMISSAKSIDTIGTICRDLSTSYPLNYQIKEAKFSSQVPIGVIIKIEKN